MEQGFSFDSSEAEPQPKSGFKDAIPGEITTVIGSGHHAQASIVWQTIKWSFISGSCLTIITLLWALIDVQSTFTIDHIESIWSIFIPIITLALGYIFGRGSS